MPIEGDTLVRLLNLILVACAVAGMTHDFVVRRDRVTRRVRRIMMWIYLVLLNMGYATAINVWADAPLTLAVQIFPFLLTGLVASLIWNPPGDDLRPIDGGKSFWDVFVLWLDRRVREWKAR